MSRVPVIEVQHEADGVWGRSAIGVESVDSVGHLDELPTCQALVRIGGALKKLTVYLEGREDGYVRWQEAFGAD